MRWMNYLYFPLCLLILAGCSSGPDSVPSGVLSHDKMQQVLWDIIEADQYSMTYLRKDSARIDVKAETAGRYEQVFQLHKISRDEFDKSIQYYFSRPDIAKPLFDSLAAMGVRRRSEDYGHGAGARYPATIPVTTPRTVPNKVPPVNGPSKNVPNHFPGNVPANNIAPNHMPPGNVPGHIPPGKMPDHHLPKKIQGPVHDSVPRQKL